MQTKTTMKLSLPTYKYEIVTSNIGEDAKKLAHNTHSWRQYEKVEPLWKRVWQFLIKLTRTYHTTQ